MKPAKQKSTVTNIVMIFLFGMIVFVTHLLSPVEGILGRKTSTKKQEAENLSALDSASQTGMNAEIVLADDENKTWVDEHVNKNFLLGKVTRRNNPLFVKVDARHTARSIFLLRPVYEAYKKMYEAAMADSVKLVITSGHRVFYEQVYEWEIRWKYPRTNTPFSNDVEKARYLLKYRSMPGTSRHHWGTDIDLNSNEPDYYETREGKKMYDWLKKNAATYGFFQPYTPLGEQRSFGYQEEKWHWSYRPLARLMLIKYLELVSIDDITGFEGDAAAKELPVISEWVCGINPQINETDL